MLRRTTERSRRGKALEQQQIQQVQQYVRELHAQGQLTDQELLQLQQQPWQTYRRLYPTLRKAGFFAS